MCERSRKRERARERERERARESERVRESARERESEKARERERERERARVAAGRASHQEHQEVARGRERSREVARGRERSREVARGHESRHCMIQNVFPFIFYSTPAGPAVNVCMIKKKSSICFLAHLRGQQCLQSLELSRHGHD